MDNLHTNRAFTLVELLVVISIISMLMAILVPAMDRAREKARIVVANSELYGIAVALESYSMDNNDKYPPTRIDCNPTVREHAYALPQELIDQGYLPKGGEIGRVHWAKIEDEFNKGNTYKYIAAGPRYDFFGTPFADQPLYMQRHYPYGNQNQEELVKFTKPSDSPVTWVIFSVGPRHDKQKVEQGNFPINQGYPVLKKFWYSARTRKGTITRLKIKKGQHIGTFENN